MTTFHWEECSTLPQEAVSPSCQSVLLNGKIYVGNLHEDTTRKYGGQKGKLCISSVDLASWTVVDTTPTYSYGLTTHNSQLVLVGGMTGTSNLEVTNELWLSTEGSDWYQTLPPMPTKRILPTAISIGECLVVVGGQGSRAVEVLIDGQWSRVHELPFSSHSTLISTLHNENMFVSGGFADKYVYCRVSSLMACAVPSRAGDLSKRDELWRKTCVRVGMFASFQQEMLTVGWDGFCGYIYAYSPYRLRWIHVADMPAEHCVCDLCNAWVLPSGELIVMGTCRATAAVGLTRMSVHKASLRSKHAVMLVGNNAPCGYKSYSFPYNLLFFFFFT